MTRAKYRNSEYSGFDSSAEILEAIEDLAGGLMSEDGEIDEEGEAYRVWASPTEGELAAVVAAAWKLADSDTDELFWGDEKLTRPA